MASESSACPTCKSRYKKITLTPYCPDTWHNPVPDSVPEPKKELYWEKGPYRVVTSPRPILSDSEREKGETRNPSSKAIVACGYWLAQCVDIGWPKSSLDELAKLWWKYHDDRGKLIEVTK
jgi:hypothetical protein